MFNNLKQAYFPETDFPTRVINTELCTKCGRCSTTCPCYGFKWEKDNFPEPIGYGGFKSACLNCGNCIAVCPVDAITMTGSYSVHSGRYQNSLLKKVTPPDPLRLNGSKRFEEFEQDLTEVERSIYSRRSNRLFKTKKVERKTLERILEAGRFAPSAGNCQPYKFIIVTDQNLIKEYEKKTMRILRILKNFYLYKEGKKPLWKIILFTIASWLMINKFDPRPVTAIMKADNNNDTMHFDAPAVILILKDKRGVSNPDLDVGICAQNMVLAAHSLGLGTCYISLPITPFNYPVLAGLRKKFGIKNPYEAVTSLAIGYPKGKIDTVVPRDTPPVEWIEG